MNKSKWKDVNNADYLINLLSKNIVPEGNTKNVGPIHSRQEYKSSFRVSSERYEKLLAECVRFNPEVPNMAQKSIVSHALFQAADRNMFDQNVISELVKSGEKLYLDQPNISYIWLTTLSIPYANTLRDIKHNNTLIKFRKRKPKGFDVSDTENLLSSLADSKTLKTFTYVKVEIQARCQESAFIGAKAELDFVRGIWNFTLNLNAGIRTTFGIPDRINKIVYGPVHTLHKLDGSRENSIFWYESHLIRKTDTFDLEKDYSICKKNERLVRSIPHTHSMWRFIKNAFVLYCNALDDEDMTGTFLKLWSLLEYLTSTEETYHIDTVDRASQIYVDKKVMQITLNGLRRKRNQIVHYSEKFDSAENDTYVLLQVVNALVHFIVFNINLLPSKNILIELLSLPLCKEEADEEKCKLTESLKRFELADKFKLFDSS